MAQFHGVYPAMITPLTKEEKINIEGLEKLIAFQKGQNAEYSPRSLLSAVPEAFCRQIISGMFLVNAQKHTRAFVSILSCDTWLLRLFHPKTVAPRFLAFAEFCMLVGCHM